jgi:predicted O-methyltransferase YrrM
VPTFSTHWWDDVLEAQWRSIFQPPRWHPDRKNVVVEIGSFEGRSTLWILNNLLKHPESRLHSIDTFEGGAEHRTEKSDHRPGMAPIESLFHRFSQNIAESGHTEKVTVHRGQSWKGLAQLLSEDVRADFVLVDGSHAATDVLSDLTMAWRLLKVGGILIADDYLWSDKAAGQNTPLDTPKIAVDAFTTIYSKQLTLFRYQRLYQLAMQKIAD